MKRISQIAFSVIFILAAVTVEAADWRTIPTGNTSDLKGLFFINENLGFTVSKKGAVYLYKNDGEKWEINGAKFPSNLNGVVFINEATKGFLFGDNGSIIHTLDSGETWLSEVIDYRTLLKDMAFFDSLNGIAIGTDKSRKNINVGVAYKTSDSGKSWKALDINCKSPLEITLSPEGILALTCKTKIYISENRGETWSEATTFKGALPKNTVLHGNRGLVVGMGGLLAVSEDYGKTWRTLSIFDKTVSFFDAIMIDSLQYYVVGSHGTILFTDDGGENWIPEESGSVSSITDIQLVGDYIFACGRQGTLIYTKIDRNNPDSN